MDQNSRKKELNKTEISNLSDAKFHTLVIRMLKELVTGRLPDGRALGENE